MISYRIVHQVLGRIRIGVSTMKERKTVAHSSSVRRKGHPPQSYSGKPTDTPCLPKDDTMTYPKNMASLEEEKCILNRGGLHEGNCYVYIVATNERKNSIILPLF